MAFVALTNAETAAGEPTKQELFNKIQDNFDDHETRIGVVEGNTSDIVPVEFYYNGPGEDAPEQDGVLFWRVPFDVQWLGARVILFDDGTTGTLDIDIESKSGVGAFTTILTGNITVANGGGDFTVTSGTILGSNNTASAGDFLRVNVDNVIDDSGAFAVIVEFESN